MAGYEKLRIPIARLKNKLPVRSSPQEESPITVSSGSLRSDHAGEGRGAGGSLRLKFTVHAFEHNPRDALSTMERWRGEQTKVFVGRFDGTTWTQQRSTVE
ncbi:hypothetical protein AAG570_006617 [Ranatra chinensis]|uniref:Uncharacterized protein n=1 Tax=Ranatra chinensis TaxID=642074 RepID=A0ABD0YWM6_9HEMI